MTNDLMNLEKEKKIYDISKDHFNSHRLLYRESARIGINQFITWCFLDGRAGSEESVFTLSGLEGIFNKCFTELRKLDCSSNDSSTSCKLKNEYIQRSAHAKLLKDIINQKSVKNVTKISASQNLSKSCEQDIAKAQESSKSMMCTQSIVSLICPTGENYNAANGCVGHLLVEAGWKRK
jgi:hypothetical protein